MDRLAELELRSVDYHLLWWWWRGRGVVLGSGAGLV
jgi:hypothetical protein